MATTKIDVSGVRGSIAGMTRLITEQNAMITDIEKQAQALNDVWDDAAQKTFVQEFAKTKKEVNEFNSALQNYVNMMKDSVDKFAALDTTLRNSFNR